MNYVIAGNHSWCRTMAETLSLRTGREFFLIDRPEELTLAVLSERKPRYVFFPHWSYIVPKEIYDTYECVMFHMTDLPFGRGGSPLQNLIVRGIYDTQVSAFRCADGVDTGPVYCKRPLSLHGNAEEIYLRANGLMAEMAAWIIDAEPQPTPQTGEVTSFPRRKPDQSDVSGVDTLKTLYDYIRMLDAEGYPRAFLETEHFRLEFERASLKSDEIHADVVIRRKTR